MPLALLGLAIPGVERLVLPYDLALLGAFVITGRMAAKTQAVTVRRKLDAVLSVRAPNRVTLEVENGSALPTKLRVLDEVPELFSASGNVARLSLKPRETQSFTYQVVPRERGRDGFRGTFVRIEALLGLAYVQKKLDTEETVKVYPNVKSAQDFELLKQKGRLKEIGLRRSRSRGLGREFESLREYNDDDFRFIDWKSTARRGKLVVRNFEQERNQAVIVVLDLGRHMLGEVSGVAKVDHALDAALLLFHTAERAGDLVGLYAFNDSVQAYLSPKRGRAQVAAVLDAAYDLRAEAVQPNYAKAFTYLAQKWKRRSLVVVFTDAENSDQAEELASALNSIRRHHLLLVVRVKDSRIEELTQLPVTERDSLFSRASATIYEADRRQAEAVLAMAGISTIESEPETLPAALVAAFLHVKERALL